MHSKDLNIALIIDAAGNALNELKKIDGQIKKTTAQVGKMTAAFRKVSAVASKMKAQFTKGAMVLGGLGALGKFTESYEEAVAEVATLTKMSVEEVEQKWGDGWRSIARDTGTDLKEIVKGSYQALSSSVRQEQLMKFMRVATKASVGGFTEVKTSVDGMTNILNSWGGNVEQIGDIFLNTQNLGKTTFGELASSMGKVIPTASKMGVKFKEIMSAAATLTMTGSNTAEAMTAIRATITAFAKSTEKQKKRLKELGLEDAFTLDSVSSKGYVETLKLLMDRIKATTTTKQGMANAVSDVFGRVEGLNALLALTSNKGMKKYAEAMAVNSKRTNSLNKAAQKMEKARSFKKMKVELQILAITIGKVLIPVIRKFFITITPWFKMAAKWIQQNKEAVGTIMKVVAAVGLLKVAIGGVGFVLSGLIGSPILLGIAAVGLAVASLTGNFKALQVMIDKVLHKVFKLLGINKRTTKEEDVVTETEVGTEAFGSGTAEQSRKAREFVAGQTGKTLVTDPGTGNTFFARTASANEISRQLHGPEGGRGRNDAAVRKIALDERKARFEQLKKQGKTALEARAQLAGTTVTDIKNHITINQTINAKTNASAQEIAKEGASKMVNELNRDRDKAEKVNKANSRSKMGD